MIMKRRNKKKRKKRKEKNCTMTPEYDGGVVFLSCMFDIVISFLMFVFSPLFRIRANPFIPQKCNTSNASNTIRLDFIQDKFFQRNEYSSRTSTYISYATIFTTLQHTIILITMSTTALAFCRHRQLWHYKIG